MRNTILSILLVFSVINAKSQNENIIVKDNYSITSFEYFSPGYNLNSFAIIEPGLPLVPIKNGIYIAGTGHWLKPPSGDFIQSLSSDLHNKAIYAIRGLNDSVYIRKLYFAKENTKNENIAKLPKGLYNLKAIGFDSLLVWGVNKKNEWKIYFSSKNKVQEILSHDEPITSVAIINKSSFACAINNKIYIITPDDDPILLLKLENIIESIAITSDGIIYISTQVGIFCINKDKQSELIVAQAHGQLEIFQNQLFVLYQEKNQVLLLSSVQNKPTKISEKAKLPPFMKNIKGEEKSSNWRLKKD